MLVVCLGLWAAGFGPPISTVPIQRTRLGPQHVRLHLQGPAPLRQHTFWELDVTADPAVAEDVATKAAAHRRRLGVGGSISACLAAAALLVRPTLNINAAAAAYVAFAKTAPYACAIS
jgi:hypothetical protein